MAILHNLKPPSFAFYFISVLNICDCSQARIGFRNIYSANQAGPMLTDSGHSHWQINGPLSQPFTNLQLASSLTHRQEDCWQFWMVFPEQWKKKGSVEPRRSSLKRFGHWKVGVEQEGYRACVDRLSGRFPSSSDSRLSFQHNRQINCL